MTTNIRLTKTEQEKIRNKCISINKILVKKGMEPLKDSELVHAVLPQAIDKTRILESGKIYIEE